MIVTRCPLAGLLILAPRIVKDGRGYFFESFRKSILDEQGIHTGFVQDNESCSQKDVIRGLHFQSPPCEQAKLIRVVKGAIMDVVVDIRKKSSTYGKHYSVELSERTKGLFYVPAGFAHGFATLEDNTIVVYKCSQYYNRESEGTLLWNDPDLGIDWKIVKPVISDKDSLGKRLKVLESPFD